MTYELERQQKERKLLFEEEMNRRMADLRAYMDFINWAHYLVNHSQRNPYTTAEGVKIGATHNNQVVTPKVVTDTLPLRTVNLSSDNVEVQRDKAMFHSVPSHIPNSLEEWCGHE